MADERRGERDLGFTAAVALLALLPRLYVAIAWAREPVWDGHYYDFGARRIAAGLGYSDDVVIGGQTVWHPWCHYPVGYSGLLSIVYRVFGGGPAVAPITNAVIGALLVAVVHRLARHATSRDRARAAALISAAMPGLILYSALVMTEPLAALGAVVAAWLMARDARARPLRAALLAGLVVGATTLVRPPSLACAPAMALIAAAAAPNALRLRRAAVAGAIATAAALLVVAPWTLRNCRTMDGCALVSTNAGWNLAIGAFPRATGRFETLRASDGCPVVTGQVQQDRCWAAEGWRWIRSEPLRFLSLVPKKLGYTFDHESYPVGYLAEADPQRWPEERRAASRGVLTGTHRLLLCVAALSCVRSPRGTRRGRVAVETGLATFAVVALALLGFIDDRHPFWPVALMLVALAVVRWRDGRRQGTGEGVLAYCAFLVALTAIISALFFGEDRYHMVVTPALCILAACAFTAPDDRVRAMEDGASKSTTT